jgi:hypothetical protein
MKLPMRILKSETGQVLPMALILLVLGGMLVVPVLSLMSTNLTANRVVDTGNLELYSADAGVENVLWHIQKDAGILPALNTSIPIAFPDQTINGMSTVTTTLTNVGNRMYRINSIATRPGGHNTEVEAYVNCLNFSNLLQGAITSNGDLKISNSTINGKVFYADDQQVTNTTFSDDPIKETQTNWPTWDDLSPLYLPQVTGHDYLVPPNTNPRFFDDYTPYELGPLYRNGSLTVDNKTKDLTLKLTGTLYVTGNLIFGQTQDYTIDLNGQTMFVYGTEQAHTANPHGNGDWAIDFPANSIKVKGSGCIIADGNINFMPGMAALVEGEELPYVLVMSLRGTTNMKPGGPFYGSLVGSADVDLANNELTWTDPEGRGLNFPGIEIGGEVPFSGAGTIVSYTIK